MIKGKKHIDPHAFLASRTKRLPRYAYKLSEGNQYAYDVPMLDAPDIDENTMSVVIPFADGNRRDGVGDLLEVSGIVTERHRRNPCVLFDHGKQVTLPIGLAEDPETKAYTVFIDAIAKQASLRCFFYQGKGLRGIDKSADYDHALFCEQLFDLTAKRYVRSGSIGYQVISAYPIQADYQTGTPQGMHLLKTLMLEGSLVVMPCNQDTVRKALCLTKVCGKPMSPMLVKSLSTYAPPRKVQVGYQGQKGIVEELRELPTELDVENARRGGVPVYESFGNNERVPIFRRVANTYNDNEEYAIYHDIPGRLSNDVRQRNDFHHNRDSEFLAVTPERQPSAIPPSSERKLRTLREGTAAAPPALQRELRERGIVKDRELPEDPIPFKKLKALRNKYRAKEFPHGQPEQGERVILVRGSGKQTAVASGKYRRSAQEISPHTVKLDENGITYGYADDAPGTISRRSHLPKGGPNTEQVIAGYQHPADQPILADALADDGFHEAAETIRSGKEGDPEFTALLHHLRNPIKKKRTKEFPHGQPPEGARIIYSGHDGLTPHGKPVSGNYHRNPQSELYPHQPTLDEPIRSSSGRVALDHLLLNDEDPGSIYIEDQLPQTTTPDIGAVAGGYEGEHHVMADAYDDAGDPETAARIREDPSYAEVLAHMHQQRNKKAIGNDRGGQIKVPRNNELNRQNVPPPEWIAGEGAVCKNLKSLRAKYKRNSRRGDQG